ncbi:hypothetical protein VNO77_18316 [Canavalia gladiata]|uniref:Uncharacterized protein n=1 Tax=Canavalia gladiata TaxID=3824 RepID=A0AAN9QHJ3_CANGL
MKIKSRRADTNVENDNSVVNTTSDAGGAPHRRNRLEAAMEVEEWSTSASGCEPVIERWWFKDFKTDGGHEPFVGGEEEGGRPVGEGLVNEAMQEADVLGRSQHAEDVEGDDGALHVDSVEGGRPVGRGKEKVVHEGAGLKKPDKGRGKEKVVDEGAGVQKPDKGKGKQNVVDEDSDSWSDEIFDDSDDNFEGLGEDVSDESDFDIETMLEDRTDDSDEGLSWISEEIKTPINSDNEEMDREEDGGDRAQDSDETVKVNGIKMYIAEKAEGPIGLFLHGFPVPSNITSWPQICHMVGDLVALLDILGAQ